jgi:putative ABC transport system permease protein
MSKWLNEFPYREKIQWLIFPFAGFIFLMLSVLSVVYLTARAARANPVKSLRT